MPFQLKWTELAERQYAKLKSDAETVTKNRAGAKKSKSSKQEGLFKQVCKALGKLQNNPRDSGLNSHQYSQLEHPFEPGEKVWESYAQNNTPGAYRIFWCYGSGKDWLTIIAITPHP